MLFVFFFKQKTAYEMRISDWSSDVCSSDLRPGKGNAVFITIEDETGITNILLWARLFEMQRRPVMASRLMLVEGEVQRSKEGVVHLMASRVHDRTAELSRDRKSTRLNSSH